MYVYSSHGSWQSDEQLASWIGVSVDQALKRTCHLVCLKQPRMVDVFEYCHLTFVYADAAHSPKAASK